MRAETIEQAIAIMDGIISECLLKPNRLGYFAALYRTVTVIVKQRCDAGNFFEDNDRMRRLDVIFANRYFQAMDAYLNDNGTATESWQVSFTCSRKRRLIILQHLLLGMNAHISLDLGIATAETAAGELNASLERDFIRLNNLLAGLIDVVQQEISKLSPLLKVMDHVAWRGDERLVSYSINAARDRAWEFAQELTQMPRSAWDERISRQDQEVAEFSRIISSVNFPIGLVAWLVLLGESRNVRRNVKTLSNETWQSAIHNRLESVLKTVEAYGIDLSSRDTQLIKIPRELLE
jgi:hypothetical protein